jgi:steroid delta-isomerase-like uncharacterized protein
MFAVWNTHDLDRAMAVFAADYEGRDVGQVEPQRGREGMRLALATFFQAIPDVRFTLDDLIVGGARVVAVWTACGTHRGPLLNIPACRRRVTVRGVSIFTLEGDQISRATYMWDLAGLLREIGLLPEL